MQSASAAWGLAVDLPRLMDNPGYPQALGPCPRMAHNSTATPATGSDWREEKTIGLLPSIHASRSPVFARRMRMLFLATTPTKKIAAASLRLFLGSGEHGWRGCLLPWLPFL